MKPKTFFKLRNEDDVRKAHEKQHNTHSLQVDLKWFIDGCKYFKCENIDNCYVSTWNKQQLLNKGYTEIPNPFAKEEQKQHITDIMKADEKDNLYDLTIEEEIELVQKRLDGLKDLKELKKALDKAEKDDFKVGDMVRFRYNSYEDQEPFVLHNLNSTQALIVSKSGHWHWVSRENIVKLTDEEIKELEKHKLPKIGCQEGEETERHIKYGNTSISKKCLKQMERVGIMALNVEKDNETFYVGDDDLKQIYKIANQ